MKTAFYLVFSLLGFCLFAQEWKKLDSLAYIYTDYKPDSALLISQKAIFLCEKEKTKNSPEYANCIGTLAYTHYKLKNKKLADSLFKVALQIFEQRQENLYTDEYATVLNLYGIFNETILNYKVSEEAYNKALSVRLNHLKQDSIKSADLFNNLGSLMRRTDKIAQAEQYQRTAVRLYKMRLSKKDNAQVREAYYNSIRNLCKILEAKGDFLEAEKSYQELLNEMSKIYGMNNENYINALNDMGVFYGKAGKIQDAEKLFINAAQAIEKLKGKRDKDYGRTLNNRATLYVYHKIKSDEAEILLREVEKIHNSLGNEADMEYLSMKNNLGMLYLQQKNYEKAEKEFLYLLPVLEKKLGRKSPPYAITLNNLAGVYENMNKLSVSESLHKESISIKKSMYGENSIEVGHTLANLAKVYFLKKEYSSTETAYLNSLDILKKHYPPYHADILTRLIDLSNFYIYTNSTERASVYLQEAQSIIRQYYPEKYNQYYTFSILRSYSGLYYRKNQIDSALFFSKKAIEYIYQDLQTTFKTLSEDEKMKYSERFANSTFNQFYMYLINCSFNKTEQQENLIFAYQMAINNKGFVLNSMQDIRSKILSSSDTSLKNKYYQWKRLKDTYAKVSKLSVQEIEKNKINPESLLTRLNSIEKEMAYESHIFAKYNQDKIVKYKEVQDKLNRNEAAVEIIRLELKNTFWFDKDSLVYIALIMKKNTSYPDMVILPYGNSLETQYFVNYRRSIQNKSYDELSYNAFWKPIAKKLKGIKTVYFSPDGVYHQINLNTLQNPEMKKYVSDEIQVINVTNTKDILNKRTYTTKNNYLIGNPKFDLQIKTEENNEKPKQERTFESFFEGVSQLEGAEKEVKQISAVLPNAKSIIGAEATEEYVKSIKNPRILHIATHGYFKKGQYQSSTQAMLNAGLLFAGVVDYDRMDIRPLDKEDGKLTAFEVMNMELDSTELVVLSACETGLGQASKEGVYGLQRAFKVAGAQSIIMSLWKVNDEATQLLMTKFYKNWQKKGMDKRKAFETAQKDLRKQYKEPYYWGAFVMIE